MRENAIAGCGVLSLLVNAPILNEYDSSLLTKQLNLLLRKTRGRQFPAKKSIKKPIESVFVFQTEKRNPCKDLESTPLAI